MKNDNNKNKTNYEEEKTSEIHARNTAALSVRRRIEIGLNSEFNSRRLPIRLRSFICDCTHISE